MQKTELNVLIFSAGILFWLLAILPCLFYLFKTSGWACRRRKILASLNAEALKKYYSLYFPADGICQQDYATSRAQFLKDFGRYYGRRHFIPPLLFLTLVSGVGIWGVVETCAAWMAVGWGTYKLPEMVVSAFLGAYTWVVADQLARVRSRDFSPSNVYNATYRFLIAVPFGYSLSVFANKDFGVALAFLIGTFPTATLFTIARRLGSQKLSLGDDPKTGESDLEILQNVGKTNAERFADEGITTIAELAWNDPIDLSIRTNFEFNYVVDCMSQALLAVYFGTDIKKLASFSLRGAQETCSMLDTLDADDKSDLVSTRQKQSADQALVGAAKALNMEAQALYYTLTCVRDDPYTQFIWNIWGITGDGNDKQTTLRTCQTSKAPNQTAQSSATELKQVNMPAAAMTKSE